jgi:CheY-like chemotaxis protein
VSEHSAPLCVGARVHVARENLLNAAAVDDRVASGRAETLLVVEDDVLTRYAISDALRYAGYTVLEASSPGEATAILSAVAVDLLFVDLNIPGEGEGLSVAQFARDHRPEVKVIFTSGRPLTGARATLDDLGPFVRKPYLIGTVLRIIRRSLADAAE